MQTNTRPEPTAYEFAANEVLVATLRDTHALEKQQIRVLEAQLELFADYPDLHMRVTEHIVATRDQARRLEAGLEACGSSASMIKDALMSAMGLGQSSVQSFGTQSQLKAVMADLMQEHLEIATYRALLVLADEAGKKELRPRLEETLREEKAMATWFDENLEAITRRFVELKVGEVVENERVKQEEVETSPTSDSQMSGTLWQQLENPNASSTDPNFHDDNSHFQKNVSANTPSEDTDQPAKAEMPAGDANDFQHKDRT